MAPPLAGLRPAAVDPRQLARRAMTNPRVLATLIGGLAADEARFKYGCAKALRILSEQRPELLYPHFDFFARLLAHENKLLQWEAAFVLSQLARVDTGDKFAGIFRRYFSPISGPVMITAATVIQGGARIARAKPRLAERIVAEFLKVARGRYQTPECRNIAIGHALLALGEFFDLLDDPRPVLRFARKQLNNPRPATRKKAAQFLKRVQSRAKTLQPSGPQT